MKVSRRRLAGELRVATLNLWGLSGEWDRRRAVLADGLRELAPDLVAFQEVVLTDAYDQAHELLGDEYRYTQQGSRESDGRGIAIASRWPLGGIRDLELHLTPRTAGFACGALVAEVMAPDPIGPVLFVNHLPNWQLSFEYEREIQTVAAIRLVEELVGAAERHVVLVGDLDATPEAASIRFLGGLQSLDGMSVCYRDAWMDAHGGDPGPTFTTDNPLVSHRDWPPSRRIDYIFVRCGDEPGPSLHVVSCERIFDAPVGGIWGSDHFGLVADLSVPQLEA